MDTPPRQQSLIAPDHFRSHKINTTKSHDILTRLRNASILCIFFLSVEIIGGVLSQSLAVLSDAAHLFADLTSFIIAIVAARLSQLPPNAQNTFGYRRAEALAALFSMSSLLILSLFLGYEAIVRGIVFWNEYWDRVAVVGGEDSSSSSSIHVDGRVMTLTAFVGVLVNVALAVVLGVENHVHMPGDDHGHDHDHGHEHGHSGHDDHDHHDHYGHGVHEEDRNNHDHHHAHGHEEDKNTHDHHHDHHDDEITQNHDHDHDHCEDANSHDHEHEHRRDDIAPNHDHDHRHDHDHDHHNDNDNKTSVPTPLTNNGEQVPLVHHHSHDAHEEEEDNHHHQHHHHGVDEESQLLLSLSPRGNRTSYGGTCALPSSSQIQHHHEHKNNKSIINNNNNNNKKHPSHGLEQRNLNLHAAYMHVLADLAQSVSVLIAGAAIWYNPDWKLVDPVSTLIFCVLVIRSTYKIILASVSVLMNQVPTEMDWVTVYNRISNVEGVSDVHNLHLWSVSHGDRAMSVHARAENIPDGLKAIRQICDDLGIQHSTIQLQPMDIDPCVTCGDEDSD